MIKREKSNKSGSFSGNTALILTSQVCRSLSVALTWTIVARFLGPGDMGMIQIAYVFPLTVCVFLSLGLPVANAYVLGKRLYPVSQVVGNNLLWSFAGSIFAVTLLLSFQATTIHFLKLPRDLFIASLVWIPLQQVTSSLSSILVAERRFLAQSLLNIIQGVSTGLAVFLVLWVFRLTAVATTYTLMGGTAFVIACQVWLFRECQWKSFLPPVGLVKQSLILGAKGYFGNIFQYVNYRFDIFVVGYFSGMMALGIYAVAYTITELLWYIPQAFATVLMPTTASSDADVAKRRTAQVCRLSLFFGALSGILIAAGAPWVVPYFLGQKFVDSLLLIWILLPGAVGFIGAKILAADLSGRGLPQYGSYAASGGLFVTVVGNLLLVPKFGATASAAISSFVYLGEATYIVSRYSSLLSISYATLIMPEFRDIIDISDLILVRSRRFLVGN